MVYVMTYGVVLAQQRFFARKPSMLCGWALGLVSAGATLLMIWGLVSMMKGRFVDPRAVASQYALGIGFYPIIAYLLSRWQRAFLQQA